MDLISRKRIRMKSKERKMSPQGENSHRCFAQLRHPWRRRTLRRLRVIASLTLSFAWLLPTMATSIENCEIKENSITVNSTRQCILDTDSISTLDSVSVEGHLVLTGANKNLQINKASISGSIQAQGMQRKADFMSKILITLIHCLLQISYFTLSSLEISS